MSTDDNLMTTISVVDSLDGVSNQEILEFIDEWKNKVAEKCLVPDDVLGTNRHPDRWDFPLIEVCNDNMEFLISKIPVGTNIYRFHTDSMWGSHEVIYSIDDNSVRYVSGEGTPISAIRNGIVKIYLIPGGFY